MRLRQAALALLCLFSAFAASAHEIRPGLAELSFAPGEWRLALRLNLEAALAGVSPQHDDTNESPYAALYDRMRAMPPQELRAVLDEQEGAFLSWFDMRVDGAASGPRVTSVHIPEAGDLLQARESTVTLSGALPEGAKAVTVAWEAGLGPMVLREQAANGYSTFLMGGETSAPVPVGGGEAMGPLEAFLSYVPVGFDHILPKGLDHILFVVGLFLLSTRLGALLWQITAFTVAHTVTLALGLTGVVTVSPSIVEPLIALSIAWVCVENIFSSRLHVWRPVLVFCFGLLHGLGFAGVLAEFGLPKGQLAAGLIGFNVGVELGQLTVIAICFLTVGLWFGTKPWYRERIVIPASLGITAVALFWFFERTGMIG